LRGSIITGTIELKFMDNQFQPPKDVSKSSPLDKIKGILLSKPPRKRLIIVTIASLLSLVVGLAALAAFGPEAAEPDPIAVIESTYVAPPVLEASPLTGVEVSPELAARPVTGIMIENSIDARPQSGLQEAGVVFEAIAEGGITRFLALFQESTPGNIGPIRSARPYYVEWAAGFDAAYVHSGGSGEALALIRSLGVKDLDHGNFADQIASRVSSRFAPHNVYTSMERIDGVRNAQGFTSSTFTAFARKEAVPPTPEAPATASKISFDISGANYNTSYTYNAETNTYARVMAGLPHKDQDTGKQITPSVVVALVTTYGYHSNGIHSVYKTTGTGEVMVFQDGDIQKGTWSKSSQTASLEILDSKGKPMELNPGQTWITAIPSGRVSYTP
jgi:hypothetical protein